MTHNNTSPQNGQGQGLGQPNGLPSTSTFSFKAPFPISPAGVSALKHRRVSLASPSSPRLVPPHSFRDEMGLHAQAPTSGPEKKGKMRKIDATQLASDGPTLPLEKEKKPRKKWSQEETQMLVKGCQLHGVGNWKTILQDPNLQFHDRSAVDLKDRFRTYFPDAYKRHYPNARTHLSSKIRSTLSDGTSLFEKTRSKRRRPFTEAEDLALKAGYEKYGTTWATIVKNPIFQEQERRSTDLRDRFRNAYPDLYQAAGYKPRTATKKKLDGPMRAADDQLSAMAGAGPVRSRKKAQTNQGYLRGGTKSVPQSTVVSEDEESSAGEEEDSPTLKELASNTYFSMETEASNSTHEDEDEQMQLIDPDNTDPLHIPDFLPNNTHTNMDTWSGFSTPTHSSAAAWSTGGASPNSSHIGSTSSGFVMTANHGHHSHSHGHSHSLSASATSSPFIHRRGAESVDGANHFIGKSAWSEDWLSLNPRLETRNSWSNGDAGGKEPAAGLPSPPSPWSLNQPHLHSGIHDRYDLFGPYMPDGHGFGDELGTFSPGADTFETGLGSVGPSAGGTGFKGYHSQIAGDLISGASSNSGSRFAPGSSIYTAFLSSLPSGSALSLSGMYNSSFHGAAAGFGPENAGINTSELEGAITGLGLEGIPQNTGIHPMQLHAHGPNILGMDSLGLTGVSLNDRDRGGINGVHPGADDAPSHAGQIGSKDAMQTTEERGARMDLSAFGLPRSPTKHTPKGKFKEEPDLEPESFGLEDLVDMTEHVTPPATPLMTHPRPVRSVSGNILGRGYDAVGAAGGTTAHHTRSISVPPGEARNGGAQLGVPMSMDDVGLHMHHGHVNFAFFSPSSGIISGNGHAQENTQHQHHQHRQDQQTQTQQQAHYQDHRNPSPMHISMSTSSSSIHSPISPIQQHSQHTNTSQLTPIFPTHLILSPTPSAGVSSPPSSGHFNSSPLPSNHQDDLLWRSGFGGPTAGSTGLANGDPSYNLPFLDLHYYGHPAYGTSMSFMGHAHHSHSHHNSLMQNSLGLDMLDEHMELSSSARQGQAALDLAQSAVLASMGSIGAGGGLGLGLGLGIGLPLRTFSTPSPVGTIRHHPGTNGNGSAKDKPSVVDVFGGGGASASGSLQSQGLGEPQLTRDVRGNGGPGMGTIRQKSNPGPGTMGRSMSHHRGQSVVCPQDLVLRNDNKRKRASWDGGVV